LTSHLTALLNFTAPSIFTDPTPTHIHTLSLHDALPISTLRDRHVSIRGRHLQFTFRAKSGVYQTIDLDDARLARAVRECQELPRSEEHTSELQSHLNLVCRLLLEKKKT